MIDLIPKAIVRELVKLVRDRDRWKRKALDRAPVRSADRKREIEARDEAVRALLFAIAVEGTSTLSRGGQGCLARAIKALRPDVDAAWEREGGDVTGAYVVMKRFFPTADDLADEAREAKEDR